MNIGLRLEPINLSYKNQEAIVFWQNKYYSKPDIYSKHLII